MTPFFPNFVVFLIAYQGESQRPGSRVHLRIFESGFVVDRVGVDEREAFDHMQGVATKMTQQVEPGPAIEIGHIDHQRVALPVAT